MGCEVCAFIGGHHEERCPVGRLETEIDQIRTRLRTAWEAIPEDASLDKWADAADELVAVVEDIIASQRSTSPR